jgi:hypothetical protein
MGGFHHIRVEIIIKKHGTPHRGHAYCLFPQSIPVNALGYQPVNDPVVTAGAKMKGDIY